MTVTGETIKYTFTRWQQMAIKTKERNCCKRFCVFQIETRRLLLSLSPSFLQVKTKINMYLFISYLSEVQPMFKHVAVLLLFSKRLPKFISYILYFF